MSPRPRREIAAARARLYSLVRAELSGRGYAEVETPCLLPAPGMEPQITAFESKWRPEMPGPAARRLFLQTSPEYAMKRLLADGFGHVFQICKAFRNGEAAPRHNPEFTLLEFYRSPGGAEEIRRDLEALVHAAAAAFGAPALAEPVQTLSVREAFRSRLGIDLAACRDGAALAAAAAARGLPAASADRFDDVFFALFLSGIEPTLTSPVFLTEWPASMAALARILPGDPPVADRFELYAAGLELANGFGELNDAAEQRRRLLAEQDERRAAGRPAYPLDERFLEAVGRMPPSAGVAIGLDRLLMLLLGAERIDEVLLFPASAEWR